MTNTFAGAAIDRASSRRTDPAWVEQIFAEINLLVLEIPGIGLIRFNRQFEAALR